MVVDMLELIEKIKKGVRYQAVRDETEPNYGYVNVRFGNVSLRCLIPIKKRLNLILYPVRSYLFIRRSYRCDESKRIRGNANLRY